MTSGDSAKNDEIARQGRVEMERGMSAFGRRGASQYPTGIAPGTVGTQPDPQQSIYTPLNYDRDPSILPSSTGTGTTPYSGCYDALSNSFFPAAGGYGSTGTTHQAPPLPQRQFYDPGEDPKHIGQPSPGYSTTTAHDAPSGFSGDPKRPY